MFAVKLAEKIVACPALVWHQYQMSFHTVMMQRIMLTLYAVLSLFSIAVTNECCVNILPCAFHGVLKFMMLLDGCKLCDYYATTNTCKKPA